MFCIYFVYKLVWAVVSVNEKDSLYDEMKKKDAEFDKKIKEMDEKIEELKDEIFGEKE